MRFGPDPHSYDGCVSDMPNGIGTRATRMISPAFLRVCASLVLAVVVVGGVVYGLNLDLTSHHPQPLQITAGN